jgi:hypothetical protein
MRISASVHPKTGQLGSLYVQFADGPVAQTIPVKNASDPEALVDIGQGGQLIGVEVLSMSRLGEICALVAKGLPKKYAKKVGDLCLA